MISRIQNCYDSHAHFLATGQIASGLKLQDLKSAADVQFIEMKPEFFRHDWLTGFGWDHHKWPNGRLPTKQELDTQFSEFPVFFSRIDGHTSWVNSIALKKFEDLGAKFDQSGILTEQEHAKALSLLPDYDSEQTKSFFKIAQNIFNRGGFTHIRDLSMNLSQWKILFEMSHDKALTVCVDSFVTAQSLHDLDRVMQEISEMKKLNSPFLKVHGVKIFVDGSLGSRTAYLSEPYVGTETSGQLLWSEEDIKFVLRTVWQKGLDVAVHTIGDQAAHRMVIAAREVSVEGILGRLHLEHVEILRPETIHLLKPLHVTCYLQPCHWLSDQAWLFDILPIALQRHVFPWELLRKNKIPFYFGSDSPIAEPNLLTTYKALRESAVKGVAELHDDWKRYHAHPDVKWTNSWTEFSEERIVQVFFSDNPLL